jgi:hypothetical protein
MSVLALVDQVGHTHDRAAHAKEEGSKETKTELATETLTLAAKVTHCDALPATLRSMGLTV